MEPEGDAAVLVIGSGPAGLAVSKCLKDLHITYDLVDRHGDAGGAYLRIYSHIQLSSPARFLGLPGANPPQSKRYLKVDEYAGYIKQFAAEHGIRPIQRDVRRVERHRSGFAVTFSGDIGTIDYTSVVVCTGSFENPNVPIIVGLNDMPQTGEERIPFSHACHWSGPESYQSGRLLIIGGGMTAIELAEECVRNGIKPILSFKAGQERTLPAQILGLDPRVIVYPLMRLTPLRMFRRQCVEGWAYRGINRGFRNYCKRKLIDIRPRI